MHIITFTGVISSNSDLSNKLSQTSSLVCWLNLQSQSPVQSDSSSWAPLPPISPLFVCLHLFKSSWWIITTILAWVGIAYKLRNDITHVLTPLFLEEVRLQHSLPSAAFTSPFMCVHLQISYCSVEKVVNTHKEQKFYLLLSTDSGYIIPTFQTHLTRTVI